MSQLSIIEALDVVTQALYDTIPNELQESDGKIYLAKDGKQLSDGALIDNATDIIEKGNMRPATSNAVALLLEQIMEIIGNLDTNNTARTTAVLGNAILGRMIVGRGVK